MYGLVKGEELSMVLAILAISCNSLMSNKNTEQERDQRAGYTDDGRKPILRVADSTESLFILLSFLFTFRQ